MERRERKNAVTVLAPAKLNLALDVVGLLPNGYHALDMTMQAITLYERVMLRRSAGLSLRLPGSLVQPNDKNTAIKAALAFFHYTGLLAGADITIYKSVPVRAGMAGGSADDIFWISNAYLAGYADNGRLLDIGQLLGPRAATQWEPSVVDQFTRNDTLWAVPQLTDAGIAVYAGLSLLSLTGGAWIIGKKKNED